MPAARRIRIAESRLIASTRYILGVSLRDRFLSIIALTPLVVCSYLVTGLDVHLAIGPVELTKL
jgi:hypothetical protein